MSALKIVCDKEYIRNDNIQLYEKRSRRLRTVGSEAIHNNLIIEHELRLQWQFEIWAKWK